MRAARLGARVATLGEPPDLVSLLPDDGYAWIREDEGFVAWGEAIRLDAGTGDRRFERANEMVAEAFDRIDADPETGLRAIGSFTFDPARSGSFIVIPKVVVESRGGRSRVVTVDSELPEIRARFERTSRVPDRVRYGGASVSEIDWLDAVARATDAIARGRFQKVVLARDVNVWSEVPFDVPAIVGRLALRFPGCFTFASDGLVGASPERLIARSGPRIRSTVLAGSARRGRDPQEDEEIGDALLASAKDVNEHVLAVDSVKEVLGPACSSLDIDGPRLMRLANVQHLATEFAGTLAEGATSLQLAGRLHPTAAVGGTPRAAALEFIKDVEGLDRGRYAGPVGWIDMSGDGEWAIALRCAELKGTRGRLFAGNGVVGGSLPETELEETRLKLRAMESVLGGV